MPLPMMRRLIGRASTSNTDAERRHHDSHTLGLPAASHCWRWRPLALLLGAATACNDFLAAENPGAVEEPDLNDPAYASLIVERRRSARSRSPHDDITYWNGQLTDELYNRAVFVEEGQIDRRELYSDMTYINAFMYAPMQRARFLAEDAAARLKVDPRRHGGARPPRRPRAGLRRLHATSTSAR